MNKLLTQSSMAFGFLLFVLGAGLMWASFVDGLSWVFYGTTHLHDADGVFMFGFIFSAVGFTAMFCGHELEQPL